MPLHQKESCIFFHVKKNSSQKSCLKYYYLYYDRFNVINFHLYQLFINKNK